MRRTTSGLVAALGLALLVVVCSAAVLLPTYLVQGMLVADPPAVAEPVSAAPSSVSDPGTRYTLQLVICAALTPDSTAQCAIAISPDTYETEEACVEAAVAAYARVRGRVLATSPEAVFFARHLCTPEPTI